MNIKLSLLGAALLVLGACGGAEEETKPAAKVTQEKPSLPSTKDLKIYNWTDYVDPQTVADFGKQFDVKVTYDVYESDEALEGKVLSGKSGYDLVAPSNAFVGRQIKSGAYQKIDKSLIPNYRNLNPKLLEMMAEVDPGNEYAVPFFWGSNTFAINTERVKKALGTEQLPDNQWDLLFDPAYTAKLKKCGISYFDSAAEVYPLALHYLGKKPNSSNPEDIRAATELLKKNRPNVKRFTSASYVDELARGDVCIAMGFGGNLNISKKQAEKAGEKISVLMPKEGVGIWIDSFTIPKDAGNVLNAHRYINDFLEPAVAAKNGNFVSFATSVPAAEDLMIKEFTEDRVVFPNDDDMKSSFVMLPMEPETLKAIVSEWQKIKAKQ